MERMEMEHPSALDSLGLATLGVFAQMTAWFVGFLALGSLLSTACGTWETRGSSWAHLGWPIAIGVAASPAIVSARVSQRRWARAGWVATAATTIAFSGIVVFTVWHGNGCADLIY